MAGWTPARRPSFGTHSGKIDRLILLTSESTKHPVDLNDRTEMLPNAFRRIPTHVPVVDLHDSVSVRTVVDRRLQGVFHVCSFSVVLLTITECAVNGEVHCQWHE